MIHCFSNITGAEITAMIHGTVLSILLARASSIAQAEPGAAKSCEERGEPGWRVDGGESEEEGGRSEGERMGEEKERR